MELPVTAETGEREAAGTEASREHLDQELQRALTLVRLSQEIQASNQGRAALLQNSKKHLRQLLCQFKSLEVGVPRLRYSDTPKLHPLLLCVEAEPSLTLSHLDILMSISDVIPDPMASGRVTKIQFQDLNVTFRTAGQHNRWLITCSDLQTQAQLLCSGLRVRVQGGGAVQLRCVQHDALVRREYQRGLRIARGRHRLMETLSLEGRTDPRGSTAVQPAETAQQTFL
ncbi:putative uncharacterized protein C19orf81 isoform X2 [Lepisosteus oculatus]|uniref:putative uncharacterized protein C19orf81 isoform X2 n=1 Tax=Lepisosteus oculatus TaxID=7918 RepID=UPI0037106846